MRNYLLWALVMISAPVWAQQDDLPEDDVFYYGFKAGVTYSSISDIATTIIPSVFPTETYSTEVRGRLGFTGGVMFYHRFYKSRTAIQPEITYGMQGGDFLYSDIEDLAYQINFKYEYLNIAALFKAYPAAGFHFAAGPQLGFNVASTNLDYSSNMPELGPDLQITQSLREVIKGETNVSVLLGVGYDFPFGLMLEARYQLGVKDMIETLSNGFNFIENDNKTTAYSFTLGWIIEFE